MSVCVCAWEGGKRGLVKEVNWIYGCGLGEDVVRGMVIHWS